MAAAAAADHPNDHDLIAFVLRPMAVAGHHHGFVGGGIIHLADVYSVAPERLAERYAPAPGTGGGIWYFLCPARCRHRAAAAGALGQGCWASSSETGGVAARPVRGPDGRRVGQSRALSYSSYGARTAAAPWAAAVTRHGWCMVELALDKQGGGGGRAGGDFVLCKLFRSPRNEAPTTAAPGLVSGCKRKAAVDDHPDTPPGVRQHLMQRSY
ncbi:hypothetical protein SETIT_9G169600v2 [Setaria italica]|uniref:NAC domain-containing protein n=1 Tax=Setaria italica TaxID=4555 RepID=A0A368SHH0_SETIT|nr:uncharacterized protein LOC101758118 [Setaria italica]RCV41875.1 hypothetical protein SETIT_9G169600v2 [Setaria italica]